MRRAVERACARVADAVRGEAPEARVSVEAISDKQGRVVIEGVARSRLRWIAGLLK